MRSNLLFVIPIALAAGALLALGLCGTAASATGTIPGDPVIASIGWITDHLTTVVGVALALLGAVSQVAARFNLGRLGAVDSRLQTAVLWLAGNWGYAVNAAELVELYRVAGPEAALARLAELANARGSSPGA
jgi:hypothetical protein